MRVLIVEDDQIILNGMELKLQKSGFAVDAVLLGCEGLELVSINTYDAILLDVNLPDMSGYDICKAIREMEITTPIIMVTARDEVSDRVKGLDYGADDYVSKPFDFDELLARIRAVIRRNHGKINPEIHIGNITLIPSMYQVIIDEVPVE